MARKPISKKKLSAKIGKLKAADVNAISGIGALDTDSKEFGKIFAENPTLALAAKGIDISSADARNIKKQLSKNALSAGKLASTEIGVTVKHKF